MAEMLLIWILVPLVLVLLSYSFGLSLSVITRKPINFPLATILGFLIIAISGSLLTISSVTAPYAATIIGILGALSFVICLIWFRSHFRMDYVSAVAGLVTYVAYGLPVIAYGAPSWAGWVKLDDPATFLAITNRLMTVGRSVPAVVTSTYDRVLQVILDAPGGGHFSYPVGSLIPFGVVSKLTGIESAWLWQPYLSLCAALIAMIFVLILKSHIANKVMVVVASSLAVMASTIYSYVMWGGVKEVVLLIPLTLFAYTFFNAHKKVGSREYYLYSLVALGLYFIGGIASAGFIVTIIFVTVLANIPRKHRHIVFVFLGLSLVAAVELTYFLKTGNNPISNFLVQTIGDTGNLSRSLNVFQVMGIWPTQDFRLDPIYPSLTVTLIVIAIFFSLLGVYYSAKRSNWIVPSLIAASLAVIVNSYFWGGIWLTGKAIAVSSPLLLLSAPIGAHGLWTYFRENSHDRFRKFRIHYIVALLIGIVASGVIYSDAITYKNVWLAPYRQMNELREIGQLFAGQGPTLMTEYSVFGPRYFMRTMDAESAGELRVHVIPLRDGSQVPKGIAADIDAFDTATINYFNLLVLRQAPNASRPPLNYQLVWSGREYEVWKRTGSDLTIEKTLPLGNDYSPGSIPSCLQVSRFLFGRPETSKVFIARRARDYVIDFSHGDLPTKWLPTYPFTGGIDRVGSGGFSRTFSVDETRDYDFWIAGSYPGKLKLQIDSREIFSGTSIFEGDATRTNHLVRLHLSAGSHILTLVYSIPLLQPGGDASARFGPIYLSTQTARQVKVTQVSNSELGKLCKQNLDWIAIAQ
jgi:hypothetical protein